MWSTVIGLFSVVTYISVEFEKPLVEVQDFAKSHIVLKEFVDFKPI